LTHAYIELFKDSAKVNAANRALQDAPTLVRRWSSGQLYGPHAFLFEIRSGDFHRQEIGAGGDARFKVARGYVWTWLGIKPIADLEPRPGVPPTASHLEKVIALSKTQQPVGIVIAQHHDPKPGRWLANNMGMERKSLILPATVLDDQPDSIIRWLDQVIAQLSGLAK